MIKDSNIDIEDIIYLWHESFGDTAEDIIYFINNAKHAKCVMCYHSNKAAAMIYLVDCSINGKDCEYIYAACTALSCRNNGYMTELLNYAKQKYSSICLIPAENWLIDYYNKRGFSEKIDIDSIKFFETHEIKEYLFEGCVLEEPIALLYKGD